MLFPLYEVPRVVRFRGTESRIEFARDWGKEEMGKCCLVGIVSTGEDENTQEMDSSDGSITV